MSKAYTVEQLERLLECAEQIEDKLIMLTGFSAKSKKLHNYIFGSAAPEKI